MKKYSQRSSFEKILFPKAHLTEQSNNKKKKNICNFQTNKEIYVYI